MLKRQSNQIYQRVKMKDDFILMIAEIKIRRCSLPANLASVLNSAAPAPLRKAIVQLLCGSDL
jgi:hypothetical protein